MISDFQRQSRYRKMAYTGIILGLFCVSLFYRTYNLERHAETLAVREQSQGDVGLMGATVRLSLTGSQGLVLAALWWSWNEKDKRQEWNEMDILTRAITQLQPHFMSPWMFQSWHLAYN